MVICNTKLLSAQGFFCGLAVRSFFVNIVRWLKEPHKNFPPQGGGMSWRACRPERRCLLYEYQADAAALLAYIRKFADGSDEKDLRRYREMITRAF